MFADAAGSVTNLQTVKELYGAQDEAAANVLANELSKVALPPGQLLLSPGDVIADNGLFMYHRASAHRGMAGSAVRSITQPQLLLGTHIGAAGEWQQTVICVSLIVHLSSDASPRLSSDACPKERMCCSVVLQLCDFGARELMPYSVCVET